MVHLQRPSRVHPIVDAFAGTSHSGGTAGVRARPELHLGAAQPRPATAKDRDGDPNPDNHAAAADDDNHTAAAAANRSAAAIRSVPHHNGPATARAAASAARGRAAPSWVALMARLLSARAAGASSAAASTAQVANVSESRRYTGDP